MGILGPKCEGCWERVEDCSCGRYPREDVLDKFKVVHQYEIDELKESINELKDKFNALIEELRNKNL